MIFVQPDQIQVIKESYKEQAFDYREMKNLTIHLAGKHQLGNAAAACEAAQALPGFGSGDQRRIGESRVDRTIDADL